MASNADLSPKSSQNNRRKRRRIRYVYHSEDEGKNKEFNTGFLRYLEYIPDINNKARKTVESLMKTDSAGKSTFSSLPIYLINAHSQIDLFLSVEQPDDMEEDVAKSHMEYLEPVDQLVDANFFLEESKEEINFFNTKPESNVFVVTTTPVGFDSICGDKNLKKFLLGASNESFSTLRTLLLSDRFSELFTSASKYAAAPVLLQNQRESHSRYFRNTMFFPPGYSVLNRTYQFWDHDMEAITKDKWGVIRLDTLTTKQLRNGALENWAESSTNSSIQDLLDKIHPLTQLKQEIERSIIKKGEISLKEITDQLGPGIYLDFGCCALIMHLMGGEEYENIEINPDLHENIKYLPIYGAIQEGLEVIKYMNGHSWRNIVSILHENASTPDDIESSTLANKLIQLSGRIRASSTNLQHRFQAFETNTLSHLGDSGGGKKKKTRKKRRRKRKSRRKRRIKLRRKLRIKLRRKRKSRKNRIRKTRKRR